MFPKAQTQKLKKRDSWQEQCIVRLYSQPPQCRARLTAERRQSVAGNRERMEMKCCSRVHCLLLT